MSAKDLAPGDKITVLMLSWMEQIRGVVVHSYPELFSFMADGISFADVEQHLFDRQVADEGLTWCRGWDDAAGEALKAARLLAGSNPLRLP